jgi:hypothetical protein
MTPAFQSSPAGPPQAIKTHLALGIVGVFLCWPVAVFAIWQSTRVTSLIAEGRLAEAEEASKLAKKLGIISVAIGGGFLVLALLICCGAGGIALLAGITSDAPST